MSSKTIIGKAENIKISETIENYIPNIPEQILTAKKNICKRFEDLGIDKNMVQFEIQL